MYRYIAGRMVAAIPVLVGISIVVFLLTSLIPGDVVTVMLGMMRSPQAEATLRRLFGLDVIRQQVSKVRSLSHGT